jgi:CBS domain containing-hemolysin-like protein
MHPTAITAFLLFALSLILSGLVSAMKLILGFYQKQSLNLALSGDSPLFQKWIEEASNLWKRPGFFESLSIGRFFFDCSSIYFGAIFWVELLPIGWGLAFAVSILTTFTISHWAVPLASQAYAPSLGGAALRMYRAYSLFLMGGLGVALYNLNETLLRRLGHDSRLGFLGETEISRIHPEQEGDHVDRSGLKEEEKEMIRSIFDLRETQAKEVMTPRVDVIALEIHSSYREAMDLITHEKFSRIPVYEENIDHIKGILHVMDLMGLPESAAKDGFRLEKHIREAYFVPRTKKIGDLMREFRLKHNHMAIVVDEYGGTSGIITLEDILEEIVGEIHDEDEIETQRIKKVEEGVYIVDPIISISDLKEELGIDLRPEDEEVHIDTLGGFILYVHGRVPRKGDLVRHKGMLFEIVEMEGNKIERIRLRTPALANVEAKV